MILKMHLKCTCFYGDALQMHSIFFDYSMFSNNSASVHFFFSFGEKIKKDNKYRCNTKCTANNKSIIISENRCTHALFLDYNLKTHKTECIYLFRVALESAL